MQDLLRKAALLWVAAISFAVTLPSVADPIYRNSSNDLTIRFAPGTLQVGDEVRFTNSPLPSYITNFSFEYWGTNTASSVAFSGSVEARVRFYLNNGPLFNGYDSPGTAFFDSGWFGGFGPTPRSTIIFDTTDFAGGLYLPDSHITWTVQFQGMGATDSLGLDLYSPPTIGQSIPGAGFEQDYWLNSGSSWSLVTATNNPPFNFGATFDAAFEPVPEPSAIIFSCLGGFGLLTVTRRLRRQS